MGKWRGKTRGRWECCYWTGWWRRVIGSWRRMVPDNMTIG